MKNILLFGAGKSATVLIAYLLNEASREGWKINIVDGNRDLLLAKTKGSERAGIFSFDIHDETKRTELIKESDLVISLLPPALHLIIAKDCISFKKNMLTASYVDGQIRNLDQEIEANDLLFLCEMGLDPGIDHMSAKKMIDRVENEGGRIYSFLSHCGGLVAKESDDNPWHYKISWNPRNVVVAGKGGAVFKLNNEVKEIPYKELFKEKRYISIPGHDVLCWYPNRDSLSYISTYGLEQAATFIRTTLRHPDFMYGWQNIIDLELTSETHHYDTDNRTLGAFFKEHLDKEGFSSWLENKLHDQFTVTKGLLSQLVDLVELEQKAADKGIEREDEFMVVDDKGSLKNIDIDDLKINAAASLADRMHDASLTLKQLFFLGMDDHETLINKGICSAASVLQFALEKKLVLGPKDKDAVIMMHEIEYTKHNKNFRLTSSMVLNGENDQQTAMAKTVGLPLGIAAKLILNGTITAKGLVIPTGKDIYTPVLNELEKHGIIFNDENVEI